MVTFQPWKGAQYSTVGISGVRLLVLGEAHYGKPSDVRATFTCEMVEKLGRGKKRFRFFTTVPKLVLGMNSGEWISNASRREFWDRVAFYNFIQSFPGESARIPPTNAMWEAAAEPFTTVLESLAPHLILVCGKRLSSRLPTIDSKIATCSINHPSSGIRYADWQPSILAAIQSIQSRDK